MSDLDVVVVGAGMAGLYALKVMRDRGLSTLGLERGSGVGGTWYWNRYPGARCDVPSLEYSYGFDPLLEQEWDWSEHFAAQPEIERYLNHVADRYDLRRDIQLDTAVASATFDEDANTWVIETDRGDEHRARFCIMATGGLSAPHRPDWPGIEGFGGTVVQTSRWPDEPIDLDGRRIGIVGTGSSGVQAIPELARVAAHLTVFQRSAAYSWPSTNRPLTAEEQAEVKGRYRQLRAEQRAAFSGFSGAAGSVVVQGPIEGMRILESTPAEREAALEEYGFNACRIWTDTSRDVEANAMAVELFCEMVRRTVHDPDVAEALLPNRYPLGCKRPVVDAGYFETFNRDNVDLVDLTREPIDHVTELGVVTSERTVPLDLLILATGFDAMTGALTRIDVRGRDGRLLRDEWADGPATHLGMAIAGYPNLFVCVGPGSPSVLANYPTQIEFQVDWLARLIAHAERTGAASVEATTEAQQHWSRQVDAAAEGTMWVAPSCNSWYNGANVEGKARVFLPFVGGLPDYVARCEAEADSGFAGFRFGAE